MKMTAEQKVAKESAGKFIIYLYKKYYPQIEAEMERREGLQKSNPSHFFFLLGLPFFSYLRYNKENIFGGRKK